MPQHSPPPGNQPRAHALLSGVPGSPVNEAWKGLLWTFSFKEGGIFLTQLENKIESSIISRFPG